MDTPTGFAAFSSAASEMLLFTGFLLALLQPAYLGFAVAVLVLLLRGRTVTSPAHRIRLCAVPFALPAPYLAAWGLFHLADSAAAAPTQGGGPAFILVIVGTWLGFGLGGLLQVAAFAVALGPFRHAWTTPGPGNPDRSAKAG